MKFTTNLLSSNTLTHLKKCTFRDFEDFRLKDFADGVHSLDENFPEFVELFRQVEKQLIFENMLSSEMFITDCLFWGKDTGLHFEDNPTLAHFRLTLVHIPSTTYFNIIITIDPVEKTCVAKAEALDNDRIPIEKEFESFSVLFENSLSGPSNSFFFPRLSEISLKLNINLVHLEEKAVQVVSLNNSDWDLLNLFESGVPVRDLNDKLFGFIRIVNRNNNKKIWIAYRLAPYFPYTNAIVGEAFLLPQNVVSEILHMDLQFEYLPLSLIFSDYLNINVAPNTSLY
ncbi:hypothetical protein VNN37_10555 (plasmid) [Lactococcus garvieae]|uniref:hypothetical protein n=1 Tax=Lactococcus garvieae TaxID=1363 RepID=UPI0030D58DB6